MANLIMLRSWVVEGSGSYEQSSSLFDTNSVVGSESIFILRI